MSFAARTAKWGYAVLSEGESLGGEVSLCFMGGVRMREKGGWEREGKRGKDVEEARGRDKERVWVLGPTSVTVETWGLDLRRVVRAALYS